MAFSTAHARADGGEQIFDGRACIKRGLLGKCLSEDSRLGGDGDEQNAGIPQARLLPREESSSPLIERLREQTEANRAKNERQRELESFANSQSGLFGPFSRFEPVEKPDGAFVLVPVR